MNMAVTLVTASFIFLSGVTGAAGPKPGWHPVKGKATFRTGQPFMAEPSNTHVRSSSTTVLHLQLSSLSVRHSYIVISVMYCTAESSTFSYFKNIFPKWSIFTWHFIPSSLVETQRLITEELLQYYSDSALGVTEIHVLRWRISSEAPWSLFGIQDWGPAAVWDWNTRLFLLNLPHTNTLWQIRLTEAGKKFRFIKKKKRKIILYNDDLKPQEAVRMTARGRQWCRCKTNRKTTNH